MTLQHIAAGNRKEARVEFLIIRGFLSADLTFHPTASQSTFSLQPSPHRIKGAYFAELRDDKGKPLNRQSIDVFEPVVCFNNESSVLIVDGRIALRKGATRLLLFKKDILIDERPILKPPSLELAWKVKKADRKKDYSLALRYSDPLPGAYLQLFYQWDDRNYQQVGLLAPKNKISINFTKRPGGKACRLIVAYTNGMRTTVASTGPFTVPQREPIIRIVSPAEGTTFAPWHPVTLTGQISRLDGSNIEKEDLVWYLEDKAISTGRIVTLRELPPGKHNFMLKWQKNDKVLNRKTISVAQSKNQEHHPARMWSTKHLG